MIVKFLSRVTAAVANGSISSAVTCYKMHMAPGILTWPAFWVEDDVILQYD